MPELTKQEKIDAAVAVVQARAAEALAGDPSDVAGRGREYVEPHAIAIELVEQDVLVQEEYPGYSGKDRSRKRLEGQVKRLLDEEARKPDARILRFSSVDDKSLPRLNGTRRGFYGPSVGYTTPELHERALTAVAAADAQRRAERDEMAELLARVNASEGFPAPIQTTTTSVTFSADGLRELLDGWADR
jgi:hypothetical protein